MNTSVKSIIFILKDIFLFKGMDPDIILSYAEKCRMIKYIPGEVIHSSSDPADGIGVIVSGKAKIVSGNGDALIRMLTKGDIFGAASVFACDAANRTAVISGGNCNVLLIPTDIINDIITTDNGAAKRYIGFLSDRINFLNSKISTLTAGDAIAKTAGFLLSLDQDPDGKVILEGSLKDVASKLNMGRASLYRTIDRFVTDGIIIRNKDEIMILNRADLEDIIKKRTR